MVTKESTTAALKRLEKAVVGLSLASRFTSAVVKRSPRSVVRAAAAALDMFALLLPDGKPVSDEEPAAE